MESVKEILCELEKREEFVKWRKKHKKHFLAYLFNEYDTLKLGSWQIGYSLNDRMTTFLLTEPLEIKVDQEVYKTAVRIREIHPEKVRIEWKQAVEIATEFIHQTHAGFRTSRVIIVLQSLDIGQIWNLTLLSRDFSIMNIKIDSTTGKILKHELSSMIKIG